MARSGGGNNGSLDCIRSVENAMAWLFGGVVVARTTTDEMQLTNFMMGTMMKSEDQSDEARLET